MIGLQMAPLLLQYRRDDWSVDGDVVGAAVDAYAPVRAHYSPHEPSWQLLGPASGARLVADSVEQLGRWRRFEDTWRAPRC